MYVSLSTAMLGLVLLLPNAGVLLGWPCFVIRIHLRVVVEERFLTAALGPAYAPYCRRVGRYATLGGGARRGAH